MRQEIDSDSGQLVVIAFASLVFWWAWKFTTWLDPFFGTYSEAMYQLLWK